MKILLILVIVFVLVIAIAIWKSIANSKAEKNSTNGDLYMQIEYPTYCFWPHNDSIRAILIHQTADKSHELIDAQKSEWEIKEKTQSDPEGACSEYVKITEKRNNQSEWEYHICWKRHFEWLLQFDLPRILSEKEYFNTFLLKAEAGDPDAQTLIGSCYAHCQKKAESVITPDEGKALYWWNKAAEQGHRYAMTELAIYYLNKNDVEKAIEWNGKGECRVTCIEAMARERRITHK